jgi:hypothetical protein
MAIWREHGALLAASNFVRLAPLAMQATWNTIGTIVYVDESARALRDVRKALVPRRAGEADGAPALARLEALEGAVARDVAAALKHLHAARLAFFDLHPGQIVVALGANGAPASARLVDVETIQPFESAVPPGRRVWCVDVERFEPRHMLRRPVSAETDAESLALTIDWLHHGDDKDEADKTARLNRLKAKLFDGPGPNHQIVAAKDQAKMTTAAADSFVVVRRRKPKASAAVASTSFASATLEQMRLDAASQFVAETLVGDVERELRALRAARDEIGELVARHRVDAVVCYGVGSATLSSQARVQLACALMFARAVPVQLQLFEPVLCEPERELLRSAFGVDVLSVNDEGRRVAAQRTLFFMPHCPRGLYHNLVQCNAHADTLPHVVLVGNSFAQYDLICAPESRSLVEAVADRCAIEALPERLEALAGDAVRSLAVHTFSATTLDGVERRLIDAPCGDRELVSDDAA